MKSKIKWNQFTDLPYFDASINSKDEYRNYNMFQMDIPINDYLNIQENTKEIKSRNEYDKITGFKEDLSYFDKPDEFNTKGIPTPVLEFDEFGNKTGWQEGYRRGLYAKSKGQETIHTWMAYKNRPGLNKTIAEKKYDAFGDFD